MCPSARRAVSRRSRWTSPRRAGALSPAAAVRSRTELNRCPSRLWRERRSATARRENDGRASSLGGWRLEVRRQILLGRTQDLHDRLTVGNREPRRIRRLLLTARQHFPHACVDGVFRRRWQCVKSRRVDHVAAGVLEEPATKIEVAKRTALWIALPLLRKPFCI